MKAFGYPSNRLTLLWREILVIALAAAGGGAFALLGMPAAWLSGSMLLSAVVALIRPLPNLRRPWFDSTMVLSGAILGSAATPEALAAAARYPASLVILLVGVAVIMLATGAYLRHVARWPWIDALLAAAPGALSTVLAVAQAKGANIGRISVVQLFRLLVLVALLPSVMQLSGAATGMPTPAVQEVDAGTMFGVTMAGLTLGLVFERLGLSAPLMFGATFASAALHGSGLVEGALPMPIQIAVQVLLGTTMGGRIAHIPRNELKGLFPLAIAALPSRSSWPSCSPGRQPGLPASPMPAAWRPLRPAAWRRWRCSPSRWAWTRSMSARIISCASSSSVWRCRWSWAA